jgi:hypothetical protein
MALRGFFYWTLSFLMIGLRFVQDPWQKGSSVPGRHIASEALSIAGISWGGAAIFCLTCSIPEGTDLQKNCRITNVGTGFFVARNEKSGSAHSQPIFFYRGSHEYQPYYACFLHAWHALPCGMRPCIGTASTDGIDAGKCHITDGIGSCASRCRSTLRCSDETTDGQRSQQR